MAIIKVPNAAQIEDGKWLLAHLTPIPPDDVPAEMDRLHTERGRSATCGCGECVEQFGDTKFVEGELMPPETITPKG